MPHSSGGGSHGGGSHGGSHGSHGGSRNHISNHYFHGARRYRRHHRNSGLDEYVYANSKPQKGGLAGIIFLGIFGVIFTFIIWQGTKSDLPKRLNGPAMYVPAVYDDAGLIDNDEELTETITEYYSATGICPVIYTVFDEEWNGMDPASTESYEDLETYTYCKYVDNFSDEQHFVIVYSIPEADALALKEGRITVPDYSWEAVQGDDTDPIITEGFFRHLARLIQKDLESGLGPGEAFNNAFEFAIRDSEDTFNPFTLGNIIKILRSAVPVLFVGAIIITMLVISIKRYIKDKDVEYEEVPLDSDDIASVSSGTYYSGSADSVAYSSGTAAVSGVVKTVVSIVSLVFIVPFVLSGIGMIIFSAILLSGGESQGGGFMLIFGILWTLISAVPTIKMISLLVKKKDEPGTAPLTAEYPKAEYPKAEYPKAEFTDADPQFTDKELDAAVPNPFVPLKDQSAPQGTDVPSYDQPEFDPRFFEPSKSNIEDDDEDYKRMKRQGFE